MPRTRLTYTLAIVLGLQSVYGQTASSDDRSVREFLDMHWPDAIGPQDTTNPWGSEIENSLEPQACGTCHPVQYADWNASLHSRSMGPGIVGQLVEMEVDDPATATLCLSCHAPLYEQKRVIFTAPSCSCS
jgi:hypothetical protein